MWPDRERTEALLELARGGDRAAVERLLDEHRAALARMVSMRLDPSVGRRVDASDVVQDVLLEAHRRLERYLSNPKLPFHVWLRRLASDRMIDVYRQHRLAERRAIDREEHAAPQSALDGSTLDLIGRLYDRDATPATAATGRELAERFAAALDTLDEVDREVILLRHFEQLSNQDTADVLGLSPPAAGMRYLRALRRLRAALGEASSAGGDA